MRLTELEEQTRYLKYYALPDERVVMIEVDEDGTYISVTTPLGKDIGNFQFKPLPDEDEDDLTLARLSESSFKLMEMGMDGLGNEYRRCGIGEECIRMHKDIFDRPIYASAYNAPDNGDGSHLIGNGPDFVAKMIKLGLIEPNDYEYEEQDYEDDL